MIGRRVLALVLAVAVAGCGWRVRGPKRLEIPPGGRRVGDRVILVANDGGIVWGDGRLGEVVRTTLLASGVFGDVYFPVEPRNPPSLRLEVTARGTVEEDVAIGVAKSVLIGLLFFTPAGIIQFHKTFHLDALAVLTDAEREVARVPVQSSTDVYFTLFSHVDGYDRAAQDAAFSDLGERVAAALRAQAIAAR